MVPGLVSVLMPVLNEEATVVGAITSVLSQSHPSVEVIVVDGRSADQTRELVRQMAQLDDRIRLIDNPRTTIPSGLNLGLAASRGEFVARVDGHSTIDGHYLARAVQRLDGAANLGAVGGKRLGVATTPVGRAVALALSSPFGVGGSINHYANSERLTHHASFGVYRTEVARALAGWDEDLRVNEDVDFDLRLQQHGFDIAFDPEMRFYWHVRESVVDLLRQYRRYGRGKAAMVRKNGWAAVRLSHTLPPLAVAGGCLTAVAALRRPRLLLLFGPYVLALLGASLHAWRLRDPHQPTSAVSLPLAFVAMHAAWGLGFIEGTLLGRAPATASGSTATGPGDPQS